MKNRFFNNHLLLPEHEQGFPWELNFNILKDVITHLYKHIEERNSMVFMFISITFPNIARLYETIEAGLPLWIDVNSTFVQYLFPVVLICCFRHLMLTVCEVIDVHHLEDYTKIKLIYASIADKLSRHLVIWQRI